MQGETVKFNSVSWHNCKDTDLWDSKFSQWLILRLRSFPNVAPCCFLGTTKVSEEYASSIFRIEDGCSSLPIEDSYFKVLTTINI
jgi:hypothetical protein